MKNYGRPFKTGANGEKVDDEASNEVDVKEKRSIFRLLKKFYSKSTYLTECGPAFEAKINALPK